MGYIMVTWKYTIRMIQSMSKVRPGLGLAWPIMRPLSERISVHILPPDRTCQIEAPTAYSRRGVLSQSGKAESPFLFTTYSHVSADTKPSGSWYSPALLAKKTYCLIQQKYLQKQCLSAPLPVFTYWTQSLCCNRGLTLKCPFYGDTSRQTVPLQ